MPRFTATCVTLPSLTTNTTLAPSRSTTAAGCTAVRAVRSDSGVSFSRNATLALISGRMLASVSTKRILTSTVALARSTVGTVRLTTPRNRRPGKASSWISQGWPAFTLARLASDTSASTSSVAMSAMVTTAACEPSADENGVITSPTLAFLVSTTPSNGARISVCSTATWAARRLACATAMDAL